MDVLLNDFDIDGIVDPATVTVTEAPLNGTTVVDPVTGLITYTPDADLFGEDTFSYTVADDDGAVSQAALVSLAVTAVNDPPVVQPDNVSLPEDVPTQLDVLSNDNDIDNVLTVDNIVVTVAPVNGSLTFDSGADTVTYTPAADFFGGDTFEYSLLDAGGAPSAGSTRSLRSRSTRSTMPPSRTTQRRTWPKTIRSRLR